MEISPFLKLMVEKGASDLFFSVGAPVNIKIEGVTRPLKMPPLQPGEIGAIAHSLMSPKQIAEFETRLELNLALVDEQIGRFRVNLFMQRGETGMVVRHIKSTIPPIAELGLPPVLERLVMLKRGLVLIVGATGSGKSTTLAAMVNHRNRNASGHILTVEEPIEFIHEHQRSVVDQREVGIDTLSYDDALKNAMREAPDVIVIGEIRDRATMQHAIAYSETGHLCLSTLHANNANQAIERAINFFPEDAHRQLLLDLGINLAGVIAQRLVPGLRQKLVPAVEVLLSSAHVADLISKGDIAGIKDAMSHGNEIGMRTFDQALFELFMEGRISREEALRNADSRTDLSLRIRLQAGVNPGDGADLTIEAPPPGGMPPRFHK